MKTSKEQQEMMQWMRDDPVGFSAKMREQYPTATEEQIGRLFTKVGMQPPVQHPEVPIQGRATGYQHPEVPIQGRPATYRHPEVPIQGRATGYQHPEIPITGAAPLVGTVKGGTVPAPKKTDDQILTEKMRK